jgi:putative ATP-dependent endonuclease of OLD family
VARIRKLEIARFRGIRNLEWLPAAGINCLIGCGDSGKSTILDAIDLCLGARRAWQFTDADFNDMDVADPFEIALTVGDLDDAIKNLDSYGLFLRGFNPMTGEIEDEPERDLETVVTLKLVVGSDLEPQWSLYSDRSRAQDVNRNLSWTDRTRLAPTRLGVSSDYNLAWKRGSVLHKLTDEAPDASAALARAARDARLAFGDDAETQLSETLAAVTTAATELGVNVRDRVRALLDAHSVSFGAGTIALHDAVGVPLRGLGVGSSRLLIAGLQRKAAKQSSMLLIDEVELGLEPHRIVRLLGALGSKDVEPPLQVFMTTHSPIALRELSGDQLFILRKSGASHSIVQVGNADAHQGAIRVFPEAFLATSVLICEGASEVGFIRGLDIHRRDQGHVSYTSCSVALVDCGGGHGDRAIERADAFVDLGYRVAVLRDADVPLSAGVEDAATAKGVAVFTWPHRRALEDELFASVADDAVRRMVELAIESHGETLVDQHLRNSSNNLWSLSGARVLLEPPELITEELRTTLGRASRSYKPGWFKSITRMELVAREVVGPGLPHAAEAFRDRVEDIFGWLTA